jgi:preprotein translocase subunit SecA
MDYLQEGIHLRALAQQDPITAYRREAYDMFQALTQSIQGDFVRYIYRVEFVNQGEEQAARRPAPQPTRVQDNRSEVEAAGGQRASGGGSGTGNANQAVSDKVPRNAPCPCGSGKKYKKCHGATV